jgi:hypothetical protein
MGTGITNRICVSPQFFIAACVLVILHRDLVFVFACAVLARSVSLSGAHFFFSD